MDKVGRWAFDTEGEAKDYIATLEDPASYEVRFDGFCWGVFLVSDASHQDVRKQNAELQAELATFLNEVAF